MILTDLLVNVADAIRTKTNKSNKMTIAEMPNEILSIKDASVSNEPLWVESDATLVGPYSIKQTTDKTLNNSMRGNQNGTLDTIPPYYYRVNGAIDTTAVTVAKNDNGWWLVRNGAIYFNYTGLAQNNLGWWYVENGQVNFNYTGLVGFLNQYFYVATGQPVRGLSALMRDTSGRYLYIASDSPNSFAVWQDAFTGIVITSVGTFYVKNGIVDSSFTGDVNKTESYHFTNGILDD